MKALDKDSREGTKTMGFNTLCRASVFGAILMGVLSIAGCYGEQLSLFDLACKSDSDCVIKDVPHCDGCLYEGDQVMIPTCVPSDYDPPSEVNCRTTTGDVCADRILPETCECKAGYFGERPAPERICSPVRNVDAGAP